jgi:hypothetical protein
LAEKAADGSDNFLIAMGQVRHHHVELVQADSGDACKLHFGRHTPMVTDSLSVIFAAPLKTMPEGTGGFVGLKPVP